MKTSLILTGGPLLAAAFFLTQCSSPERDFRSKDAAGGDAGEAGASGKGGVAGTKGGQSGGAGDATTDQAGAGGDATTDQAGAGGDADQAGAGGDATTASGGTTGADGTACSAANTCKSGRCVDGVCCNGPCDDTCQACSFALTGATNGICSAVKKGTDPHDTCATAAASGCGQTGLCGSNGVCALYDAGTTCVAASCSGGVGKSAQTCDGAGVCKTAVTSSCSPLVCGASACLTSCTANTQCVSGQVCVSSTCKAPSALLGACDETADCAAGTCISGICALTILSIEVSGAEVAGGSNQVGMTGWFKTDSAGKNAVKQGNFTPTQAFYQQYDQVTQFTPAIAPNSYLVFGGSLEGSDPLTRDFQFNLSDGTALTKPVSAASSVNILWDPTTGDLFTLFQWTGATVNVLSKTY